ncbi:uncharacterized protein LOC118266665 isoform X1 [Spodoptera frugiperda]|uniref:Uncharacterized protein LOC118266665 isoform X1 n=2 Tax=Spodoptera frugiperda TaxID=7108 RepID=A0A9R0D0C8_SPOFR|nr:uncharacterized protein LOC118266665 isoform X1 [Spodoptera frugiperda]
MMYHMKKIIDHDKEIFLPNCMYSVKYRTDLFQEDYSDSDIGISAQVIKFLKGSNKMTELEQRQEQLLKKLDTLYDRIKTISTYCKVDNIQETKTSKPDKCLPAPEEVVLVLSPDNWPWYLNLILKKPIDLNISWHIHSSVPNDKVAKIKNYVKNLRETKSNSTINLRLIFKCVSADTELKISTLDVPIVGNVNILRYLSYVYPSVIPYNTNDHQVEALLDICHLLERASDKNKEALVKKLFANEKNWINGSEFSIVDVAAYNVIKQWKNVPNYISKTWFEKTNKLFL